MMNNTIAKIENLLREECLHDVYSKKEVVEFLSTILEEARNDVDSEITDVRDLAGRVTQHISPAELEEHIDISLDGNKWVQLDVQVRSVVDIVLEALQKEIEK